VDEDAAFLLLISKMPSGPTKGAVIDYITQCCKINAYILAKIYKLQGMQDFLGEQNPGICKGNVLDLYNYYSTDDYLGSDSFTATTPELPQSNLEDDDDDEDDNGEDDDVAEGLVQLVDFV
jgi:hypothetical protein